MDSIRFKNACDKIIGAKRQQNGIGTLGEKTLHAVLKNYFEPFESNQEIRVGGYVADIVGEDGIIEIQTRQFNKLRKKLESFLEFCPVTVVYPVAGIKYLSWLDTGTGEITSRRKSPKKGTVYDIVPELYKIKYTLDNPRLRLCICILEIEETRYLNGWSKDKKKGSSRCDRVPTALLDEVYINNAYDYRMFLPQGLNDEFTSLELSKTAKISRSYAQTLLNLLTYLEVVERIGKDGNSIVYRKLL